MASVEQSAAADLSFLLERSGPRHATCDQNDFLQCIKEGAMRLLSILSQDVRRDLAGNFLRFLKTKAALRATKPIGRIENRSIKIAVKVIQRCRQ
jgi:hypothetical protein